MKIQKIKVTIWKEELKRLCIEQDWCTCCTNEEYAHMFDTFCDGFRKNISISDLESLVETIVSFSDTEKLMDMYMDTYPRLNERIATYVVEKACTFNVCVK